jgi:hypothetical protein
MVLRGVASGDEHMDESASKLQTEEEVFADEVSDEGGQCPGGLFLLWSAWPLTRARSASRTRPDSLASFPDF